jgi:hypothetical protein
MAEKLVLAHCEGVCKVGCFIHCRFYSAADMGCSSQFHVFFVHRFSSAAFMMVSVLVLRAMTCYVRFPSHSGLQMICNLHRHLYVAS